MCVYVCRNGNEHDSSKFLIYSYTKVFNGFAATLNEKDAMEIASKR